MFPDFLCIGAQKAGTTWLHENLREQPNIWVPPVKELHFLDHPPPSLFKRLFSSSSHHATPRKYLRTCLAQFIRGKCSAAELARGWHIALAKRDYAWYEKIFRTNQEGICGEICPGYASLKPDLICEVVRRNPNIRIIYMLRDPIDRAWSSMAMHFRKSSKWASDRERADITKRLISPKSLKHCAYNQNLGNWLRHVGAENIYVGWFERIATEPGVLLQEILSFLGAPTIITASNVAARINVGVGEKIDPAMERNIATLLESEIVAIHRYFNNVYTAAWLAHAEAVLACAD